MDVEAVEIPISAEINLKRHFTVERGVLNLRETQLGENQVKLVNLPYETTQDTLRSYFKGIDENVDIRMKYCVLGLPAYAVLTFRDKGVVQQARSLVETEPIEENGRTIVVKTMEDNERELIANRRIAINGLSSDVNPVELLTQLSQYGRVLHFDFPQIIHRNASKH